MLDTGRNTVAQTEGWYAPKGADPFTHWIDGIAAQGNTPFRMPLITHVTGNLWHGGYVPGIDLKDRFNFVVSLYKWERYPTDGWTETFTMYDGNDGVDEKTVDAASRLVIDRLDRGDTVLVHCQAGLNRSSLVVARALMQGKGYTAEQAISLIRENRSPACLCNPTFERWLRTKG